MVKFYTSYFYQIRFFKDYMIPLSTAVFDPKWFHDCKGNNEIFLDKRGVINGLRIEPLHPDKSCSNLCSGVDNCRTGNPEECEFLRKYYIQLKKINFKEFINRLDSYVNILKSNYEFSHEPVVVFIVYEKPDNPCSERGVLQRWFKENGIELEELSYPISENY